MRTTLTKLSKEVPVGFQFTYHGRPIMLEAWVDGVPMFSDSGCVRHDYSAALESACSEAWEARQQ